MFTNFCKDLAAQCVKTIVDRSRCGLCDKADGSRLRFACGHSACGDCVATARECPTCSPFMDSSSSKPVSDEPQTERVKHASELLTSFQDAFQIDVYQRQRISDRLKVEKELFPECIQAPSKYFNKRKSLNISKKGKENRNSTFFPGEEISSSKAVVMNKSRDFVQAWLNNSSPPSRSPLSDLKVNTYKEKHITRAAAAKGKQNHNEVFKPTRQSKKNRLQIKPLSTSTPQSSLEHYLKPVDRGSGKNAWMNNKSLKRKLDNSSEQALDKKQCDESGIVIDDCFTIEDTQDQIIDKDRLALLDVENADKQDTQSVVVIEDTQMQQAVNSEEASTPDDNCVKNIKVPFYLKSYLHKTCKQCINSGSVHLMKPEANDTECKRNCDVSITVENKSFITTIQVVDCKQSKYDRKQSTAVQTDVKEPFLGFDNSEHKYDSVTLISKIQDYIQSEAMFTEDNVNEADSHKTSCTNVAPLNKGDCTKNHHNEHTFGILTEIGGAGFQNKRRKGKRGATPDSNNSSDKENFDPNRMKKNGGTKKKKQK
ncbi:uncharacterized protein isoform X1 [Choristoneura fumiferana]|uniref:uncharacterized protein isoform X1 n=2 Tax=Choristoneura fumiferana TaxID=7141 RepID=UPI003D154CBC